MCFGSFPFPGNSISPYLLLENVLVKGKMTELGGRGKGLREKAD